MRLPIRSRKIFTAVSLLFLLLASALSAAPVRLIFDTDMGNDIDDALALAMIHAFQSLGEAKLLAVTITKDNRWSAPYVDLVNTFYGRPDIPIGVVKNGKTPNNSDMTRIPAERKRPDGTPVYPHKLMDGNSVPEATGVLRRVLSQESDQSVTIVQVGFSTNLARLLDSPGGRDLVSRKVRLLSVMAGAFPDGKPEFNVKTDIPSAQKLFSEWPTPIVASGFEVGLSIKYPATSIEKDFNYADYHPIADAYRNYKKMPYDRPTWDPTAVLYAVRPNDSFSLSEPGTITVDRDGKTNFAPSPQGKHRYLIANETQRARVLKTMVALVSRPPAQP